MRTFRPVPHHQRGDSDLRGGILQSSARRDSALAVDVPLVTFAGRMQRTRHQRLRALCVTAETEFDKTLLVVVDPPDCRLWISVRALVDVMRLTLARSTVDRAGAWQEVRCHAHGFDAVEIDVASVAAGGAPDGANVGRLGAVEVFANIFGGLDPERLPVLEVGALAANRHRYGREAALDQVKRQLAHVFVSRGHSRDSPRPMGRDALQRFSSGVPYGAWPRAGDDVPPHAEGRLAFGLLGLTRFRRSRAFPVPVRSRCHAA